MSLPGAWLWIWYGNPVKTGEAFSYCDSPAVWFYREEEFVKMARAIVLVVTLLFYVIAFGLALAAIEKRSKVGCPFLELNLVHIHT